MSGTPSELATSEMPVSDGLSVMPDDDAMAEPEPLMPSFPPYPPYITEPAPPSVADAIIAGHGLRLQHKSKPRKSIRPLPRPAKPRGPKATDVKMSRKTLWAHARCLRRHGAILTDRLESMSKPRRRNIIYLWRENAYSLPADTISRLRSMLDADEPFKPDQAYEYFVNLKKSKKKAAAAGVRALKKDILAMCGEKQFVWARNATVAFARGIQQRLSRPGRYSLADGMLRLSDIILHDICDYMHMKTPSRRCSNPKAKFMMEMSDKVAVWIDEILSESDDRMLMMDFDEDDDVILAGTLGGGGFDDDSMGDGKGGSKGRSHRAALPACSKFQGNMKKAFEILTDSMEAKGEEKLITLGKFEQTHREAATELKTTTDLVATDYNTQEAEKLSDKLTELTKARTPPDVTPAMKDMVKICSDYLAQYAEYNKEKGPAFKLLVSEMKKAPTDKMYEKGKIMRTNAEAAVELEQARGLETDHDDPNLSQAIHTNMNKVVSKNTPDNLKKDMEETLDVASKFLSQKAVDDSERGPAFDLLIKVLNNHGHEHFTDHAALSNRNAAAYVLKSAPGLGRSTPDPATVKEFQAALHKAVDTNTPDDMIDEMKRVIDLCSNYLSAFIRDRGAATKALLEMMKSKPQSEFAKRKAYAMDYATGATEVENAPALVPYLPIKDIADEGKTKLANDMKDVTPAQLQPAMQALINDVSKHLSQLVAMKSGVAGERYNMNFLSAVKKSLGARPLYKYKNYGKTYSDAADELLVGDSTSLANLSKSTTNLGHEINSEMQRAMPSKLAASVVEGLKPTMTKASNRLAKSGTEKGKAMEYVVGLMKDKGEENLGHLQGYDQTYNDGARRLENTPTLHQSTIDLTAYKSVKDKLTGITQKAPNVAFKEVLPDIIDDSANFLAAPEPETNAEKKQVLADLMSRKGENIVTEKEGYRMTYKEGGIDIRDAPVGVTKSHDDKKNKEMIEKITAVIPDKKMETVLKDSTNEGAAYLTDTVEGRGQALEVIKASLQKEGQKTFIDVGAFKKDHKGVGDMLAAAPHLQSDNPSPVILENVDYHFDVLQKDVPKDKPLAAEHMKSMTDIASKYVASQATKECGLTAEQLAELDAKGFNAEARAAAEAKRLAALGLGVPGTSTGTQVVETEEQRLLREAAEAKLREEQEKLRLAAELKAKRQAYKSTGKYVGGALGADYDPEHLAALDILHKELQGHGAEILYQQPQTSLTHGKASDWLADPNPMKVDKSVKDSSDTAHLHKKFERKLNTIVKEKTPEDLNEAMQDVVIEASRKLGEFFVTMNYNTLVNDGLVSEMQKHGNEILVEVDGAAETFFFAAQRIKRKDPAAKEEPCYQVANEVGKKLDDMIRSRPMPRKLNMKMKDHVQETSKFLSSSVTKPDDYIECYVAMLAEMEAAGEAPLIEGEIPKTYKDSANYLRQLTTYKDTIGLSNKGMQDQVQGKLKNLMSQAPPSETKRSGATMGTVISDSAGLLVSYVMLQAQKSKALDVLVKEMEEAAEGALLRHGPIRKSYKEGAELLEGKTTDELGVTNPDPVVSRKIQIKLNCLMKDNTPDAYKGLMNEVIEDATKYLAVHLLEPRIIKVCKCYKNVFVQCELWCEEMLRRLSRPCCTCSRHVSVQALQDLAPADFMRVSADQSRVFAPGVEISLKPCSATDPKTPPKRRSSPECCAQRPTTSYVLYETTHKRYGYDTKRIPTASTSSSTYLSPEMSVSPLRTGEESPLRSLLLEMNADNAQYMREQQEELQSVETENENRVCGEMPPSYYYSTSSFNYGTSAQSKAVRDPSQQSSTPTSQSSKITLATSSAGYSSRTPIVSGEHMVDWEATMVSLMWNVLAWRDWIQEVVDYALAYQHSPSSIRDESAVSWLSFHRRITTEGLQWRQYSVFSRQLTTRLHLRYRDKEITSPKRANFNTKIYIECQEAMMDIIDMFNRWTQWLTLVVKETDSLQQIPGSEIPLHQMRWNYLKKKVEEYSKDWINYNKFLKVSWEQKYSAVIADYLPSWKKPGPVWVASAYGAVPSGAVAAGIYDSEVIWVARTMHRYRVLPATLLPSKHCCLVFADGQIHRYNKYQVMCNAEVRWAAWRGGSVDVRAVSVAAGIHVGRVLYHGDHLLGAVHGPNYHCHVVIFGRPFAFNCYELLMLAGDNNNQ